MPELLAHLVGDFVLQSHKMAIRKTSSWTWAAIHAAFYGIPFLLLVSTWWQWAVIVGTHAAIDRLAIARRWCSFYGNGFPGLWWTKADGEFPAPPPFLGVWLVILVDNTMHLAINHFALRWS
jgi:hypothetical protein